MASFDYVHGNDDFLVSREAKARWAVLVKDVEDEYAREVVRGDCRNADDVFSAVDQFIQAVETMPMFGGRKCVWFKDVSFLADGTAGGGGSQVVVDLLENRLKPVLSSIPDEVVVLISATPVHEVRVFAKWLAQNAGWSRAFVSDKKGGAGDELVGVVNDEVASFGQKIEPEAVDALLVKCAGNARLAVAEAAKLATFLGDKGATIDIDLVRDQVPEFGEGDFFEVAEFFEKGDLKGTLAAVDRHFYNNKDARGLLSSLQSRGRLMIQLRVLSDAGALVIKAGRDGRVYLRPEQIDAARASFGKSFDGVGDKTALNVFSQNPYYLARLAPGAARTSLRRLIDNQLAFIDAFWEIIRRPNEQNLVVRDLCVRCLGKVS